MPAIAADPASWAAAHSGRRATDNSVAPGALAFWTAGVILFMLTQPLTMPLSHWLGIHPRDPPVWFRFIWLPFYALLFVAMWGQWGRVVRAAISTPFLLALLALVALSVTWSHLPDVTLRRIFALAFTMAFAWWVAATFSWRDWFRIMAGVWAALILCSYALIVLSPEMGIMGPETPHGGAWSGLWHEKNNLGGVMAIGALILACAAVVDASQRRLWILFGVLAVGLLLGSTSKTALLVLLLSLGVFALGHIIRMGRVAATIAFTGAFCLCLPLVTLYLVAPEVVFEAIGRDASFTGRTDIWALSIEEINKRPWTGFGYGVFWQGKEGASFWLREALHWPVPNAHHGWLDLGLDVGWLGPILFVMSCIGTGFRAMTRLPDPVVGLWAPALVGAFLLYSFSESYIMQEHNFFWVLFVATAAKLALSRSKREQVS
jgi:O-antigen ligase